jgi:hypothetical protein
MFGLNLVKKKFLWRCRCNYLFVEISKIRSIYKGCKNSDLTNDFQKMPFILAFEDPLEDYLNLIASA